jgi:predicted DNA-binding transcriptional regulator AlpA
MRARAPSWEVIVDPETGLGVQVIQGSIKSSETVEAAPARKPPTASHRARTISSPGVNASTGTPHNDPLLTAEDVAGRLNVTKDWVWDHSSRKAPLLPVIRFGDGTLRYRASKVEEFIDERERLSVLRRKRR